jgi:hypothetical protein
MGFASSEFVNKPPAVARASLNVVGKARGCTTSGSLTALNDPILGVPATPPTASRGVRSRPGVSSQALSPSFYNARPACRKGSGGVKTIKEDILTSGNSLDFDKMSMISKALLPENRAIVKAIRCFHTFMVRQDSLWNPSSV